MTRKAFPQSRVAIPLFVAAGLCVLAAYTSVVRGSTAAVALVLLPAILYGLTRYLGGIVAGLTLLLILPSWETLGLHQAGVLRVACILALATWILGQRRRLTPIDITLVAFVVITIVSLTLQDNQPHAGRIFLEEFEPLAFFVAARQLSHRSVSGVMELAFFVGTLGALTVLYELSAGHVLFADPNGTYYWNNSDISIFRPGGIFGSPPAASTVLTLTAICGLPTLRRVSGWRKYATWTCLAVTLVAMASTFTRAALIAFAVALLIYLWLSRSRFLRAAPVLIAATSLMIVLLVALPRLESNRVFQQGVLRPGTFASRVSYWKLAIPIATSSVKNFTFGIGSEAAEVPQAGGTAPAALATSPVLIAHGTHNQYVLTFLELGVVGLGALLAWLSTTFITAFAAARAQRDPVPSALAAGIAAFAIIMLADNSMLNGPSLALGGLIAGLTVACAASRAGASRARATSVNKLLPAREYRAERAADHVPLA